MSIIKTITYDHEFAQWVKNSDNYSNKFTFEGANALQAYMEQFSYDMGENIEFEPVAWCCGYGEYKDFAEFKHDKGWTDKDGQHEGYPEIETLDDLRDSTPVIEFDGGIIIQDF